MNSSYDYQFKQGIAAISWVNDDIPGLGDHYSLDHVLADMHDIGYVATEMGRTFPQDVETLKNQLCKHHMELASKFVGVLFSDPALREKELEDFRKWADFLKQMGCRFVITCEWGGSMHWDRRRPDEQKLVPLQDNEWDSMVQGLHEAGRICQARGMGLAFHPHAGTVVEQKEEIDRLMETTDPKLVNLLFDTGHAYYGNDDPLDQLRRHYDRINYVHYKDVRENVFKRVKEKQMDFRSAVLEGIFTVPGDGVIDFEPIIAELMRREYQGWTIVEAEQDPDVAEPYKYAKMAKDYLDQTVLQIENKKRN